MSQPPSTRILETLTAHGQRANFPTSRWDLVRAVASGEEKSSNHALAELCRLYWPPIYAFIRRSGQSPANAQDLTQSFFLKLLEQNGFAKADSGRGKLRTFLLSLVKHHLVDAHRHAAAHKRGGGAHLVFLDDHEAEGGYQTLPSESSTPETCYERAWAQRLLEAVMERTRGRYDRIGKGTEFASLAPYLAGDDPAPPYRELAAELKQSEAGVRLLLHRMRRRFRALLEEEIASTVSSAREAEDELGHLFRILGR